MPLDRAQQVKQLYQKLGTYEAVGRELNISRQRVEQIIKSLKLSGQFRPLPPKRKAQQLLLAQFPKELFMKLLQTYHGKEDFCSANKIELKDFDVLLKAHGLKKESLLKSFSEKKILSDYNDMINELGFHPSTTIMQRNNRWRALYSRIQHRWGTINRFRYHFGFPVVKPGNPFFRDDVHASLSRHRTKLATEKTKKKEHICELLMEQGCIRAGIIAEKVSISRASLANLLNEMIKEKLLARKGTGYNTCYQLVT